MTKGVSAWATPDAHHRLGAVLTGKTKPLGPHDDPSGIFKTVCAGPVTIEKTKIRGDEQGDAQHHGGQLCWELNARFDTPDMACRVQNRARIGRYYRVVLLQIAQMFFPAESWRRLVMRRFDQRIIEGRPQRLTRPFGRK